MKFFLSGLGNMYDNLDFIKQAVIMGDKLGFDGVIMPDHYMWGEMRGHQMPNAYSTLETWVTLTYLAAQTENIHLGTLVTPIPFRPPGMLAKMLSTLDILSGGRVVLGVGAGWSQVEFEGYSKWDEPKVRVNKTEEGLRLMLQLWTQDKVNFKGRYYEAKGAVLEPKPVQKPHPKLLFGGVGRRMLVMAGRYADIAFVPPFFGPEHVAKGREIVMRAAEKAGRADKVAYMGGHMFTNTPYDYNMHVQQIEAAVEAGDQYYLTALPRGAIYLESMRKFVEEVMPSYH